MQRRPRFRGALTRTQDVEDDYRLRVVLLARVRVPVVLPRIVAVRESFFVFVVFERVAAMMPSKAYVAKSATRQGIMERDCAARVSPRA